MNSPYSGESASPYSDQSLGVPSPPTVVAAFNRPYDGECKNRKEADDKRCVCALFHNCSLSLL